MSDGKTSALETLVGEGKKFTDTEALARGKLEADAFIQTLEEQVAALKDEIAKSANDTVKTAALEKIMSELTKPTTKDETKSHQPTDPVKTDTGSLSHEDVVKIVEAREKAAREQANFAQAMAPLKKAHGDKVQEALGAKAQELGMSVEELESLAKRSPAAFHTLVGANQRDTTTRSMTAHGSASTPASVGGAGVRNKAYYDNLQKEMGIRAFVFDSKLQVQLHKDRMALGDAWDAA